MRFSPRYVLIVLVLVLGIMQPSRAVGQVPVQGTVRNGAGYPIPGLTVSLVHPVVGRSYPCITNEYGAYFFLNVPVRPDPYYLEVYWGQTLVYRQPVTIVQQL